MTEDPAASVSRVDPNRVIPMAFKGMSPRQRQAIAEEQKRQAEMKIEEKKKEEENQRRWEKQHVAIMRAALLREREFNRQREEINKEIMNENQKLTLEQTATCVNRKKSF